MRLLDQVRAKIRRLHDSYRPEQTYVRWIAAFIRFHPLRHPSGMGGPEIEEFLTHLAVKRQVSASTQNQALNAAVVFLFKHILGKEPGEFKAVRAKQRRYLPVVLSQAEVQREERPGFWGHNTELMVTAVSCLGLPTCPFFASASKGCAGQVGPTQRTLTPGFISTHARVSRAAKLLQPERIGARTYRFAREKMQARAQSRVKNSKNFSPDLAGACGLADRAKVPLFARKRHRAP